MTRDPQRLPASASDAPASPAPAPRPRLRLHGVTVAVLVLGAFTTAWYATRPHPSNLGRSGTLFMAFEPARHFCLAALGVTATFAAAAAMELFARRLDA